MRHQSELLSVGPVGDTHELHLIDAAGRAVVTVRLRVDLVTADDVEDLRATLARIDARLEASQRGTLRLL